MRKKISLVLFFVFCCIIFFISISGSAVVSVLYEPNQVKPASFYIENRGYVDEIIYKVINQDELMVQALRDGEIDMVGQFVSIGLLQPEDYTDPNIELTETRRRGFGHLTFHTTKFPTSIRGLRQGFAYALEKNTLQQRALFGASYVTDSPIIASMGIWSCEYEYATQPCSPTGENYYDGDIEKGNMTVLKSGFYDFDGDGWREFFNGVVEYNGKILWNGTAVREDMEQRYITDLQWDGYSWDTEDFNYGKITFESVNDILGGNALSITDSGSAGLQGALSIADNWEDVIFDISGPSSSGVMGTVVTMSIEAFEAIGINTSPRFINLGTLMTEIEAGDFNAAVFEYSDLNPDPTFLEMFSSSSTTNVIRSRWYNTTFDQYWETIDKNSNFNEVLNAVYIAQQMLWQEQPLVVLYNNELTSMYRVDQFEGQITVPGEGAFTPISLQKTHLNWYEGVVDDYPDYPLGGTFVYGLPGPMTSKNTLSSDEPNNLQIMEQIEEKLFIKHPETQEYLPNIAYNWIIDAPCHTTACINAGVENGTAITFHLNFNYTWHDGSQLTGEDVAFSIQMLQNEVSPVYSDQLSNIRTMETVVFNDSLAVTIYSESAGLFEFGKNEIPIYQKSIWASIEEPLNYQNDLPKGSGPYKWASSSIGEFYVLTRNDDYYYIPVTPSPPPDTSSISTQTTSTTTPVYTSTTTTTGSNTQTTTNNPEHSTTTSTTTSLESNSLINDIVNIGFDLGIGLGIGGILSGGVFIFLRRSNFLKKK